MFWKRMASFFLAIVVGIGILPAFSAAMAEDMPYAIAVDLTNQTVTVYSTADAASFGSALLDRPERFRRRAPIRCRKSSAATSAKNGIILYLQVLCQIRDPHLQGILFHSIPYSQQRESTISKSGLEEFGYPASHGCIRLRVEDAQFIAENCLAGTTVRIYSSNEPDEELRALLYESSYTNENGLSYDDFLGIPDDPNALGRFSTGPEVEDLQYRLRALGFYSDEITGTYRTSTINAVKQLQKALGVEETGYTTPELKEIIYSSDAPTAMNIDLTEGMSGPVVLELQENLQTLSLYDGDLDSIYDVDVIEAVNLFQQVYGYAVSSTVTTEVQQAIYY
ncbi:MAG: L,D-transpeptidase family protein, partial [Merdibacter sp.]